MMRGILCILLLSCFIPTSNALEQNFSLDEGLTDYAVTDILQDSLGYIWVATRDGLNRLDGYEIKNFKHNPENINSLYKNRISCLELDMQGNIWIGTRRGVSIYNVRKERFYNLAIESISALERGAGGDMYVGTYSGCIYKIDSNQLDYSQSVLMLNAGCRFKIDANVSTMLYDKEHLWVGSKTAGLFLFSDTDNEDENYGRQLAQFNYVTSLYKDNDDRVWCTTRGGTYLFPEAQNISKRIKLKTNLQGVVGQVVQAEDKKIYCLVANSAIWEVKLENDRLIPVKEVISKEDHIHDFMIDHSGMAWVGTANSGLYKSSFDSLLFRTIPEITDDWISAFYEDRSGVKWMAVRSEQPRVAKLIRYDEKHQQINVFDANNSGIKINLISSIYEDSNRNLWLTGMGKFYQLSAQKRLNKDYYFKEWKTKERGADYSMSIAEDKAGFMWLGCWNGVFRINPAKEFLSDYIYFSERSFDHNEITSSETTFCYPDPVDSVMWIGTKGGGLNRLITPSKGENFNVKYYLKSNDIWTMHKAGNKIFAGTSNGLYQLTLNEDNNVIDQQNYKVLDGLPGNKINAIAYIDEENIWLGTNKGLTKYNSRNRQIISYNKKDGLKSNYITALLYDKQKKRIYVSSVKGINWFNPRDISLNDIAPKTLITGIKINNNKLLVQGGGKSEPILEKGIAYTQNIHLKYYENNVEFEFVGLHFADPGRNRYAYRLIGADNGWNIINAGMRSANYLKLPAGTYTFVVKSANSDGVWAAQQATLTINIQPPFWQTIWAYLLYALLAIILIILFTRFSVIKASDKYKLHMQNVLIEKERELNEAKIRFFTNISHEIRTPLTLIYAPFTELLSHFKDDVKIKKRLAPIQQNIVRLMNLIDQLLEFRKVETGNLDLNVSEAELIAFVRSVKVSFDDIAVHKKIRFVFETNVDQYTGWFDFEKLNKILYNIISNAIKYTNENGVIKLRCNVSNELLQLEVEDSGVGIAAKKQERIFDRYYQVEGTSGGTGIGLALTKALVEVHKGEILVKSEEEKGTTFTVNIPNGKHHYKKWVVSRAEQDFIKEVQREELDIFGDDYTNQEDQKKEQLPIVLVVEDEREINRYIKELLSQNYQVYCASNGVEGLEKAIKLIPDVVITDILMPQMNGIEMCQKLKSNIRTSHIPVIMLTAKSTEENQLEGLRVGANEYITKPFNPTILEQSVTNVIETLKRQKDYNKNLAITEPEKIELPSKEDEFLKKVMSVIQLNLSDSRFEVTNLCAEIGLSRMQMHRKLKAITGQSSVELIRSVRFKKAAQLLETSGMNVSEVMWEVGIESTSHFSRTFKSIYGVSPSVYMKDKRNT
ncbi:response regulator [Prolixibacteraceae bacterium JC049]|nr:response regulator [Prolixibacteraceae bacterium JC049]